MKRQYFGHAVTWRMSWHPRRQKRQDIGNGSDAIAVVFGSHALLLIPGRRRFDCPHVGHETRESMKP